MKLGVNIDHVATLRQARYRETPDSPFAEPSILQAAAEAIAGGAHGITVHLRADRRHMQDRDIWDLKRALTVPLNLELGATEEIVAIACAVQPENVCLVPENREEVTTEGGLDAAGQLSLLNPVIRRLQAAGCKVSLFIDPDLHQIEAAHALGAEVVELHTGTFANLTGPARAAEVARLAVAAELGHRLGLQINAGHGLTTANLPDLLVVPHLVELNIGHHLVSRALSIGLRAAVEEMLAAMR